MIVPHGPAEELRNRPDSPTLQQMFALARRMGYEMRPIARRMDTSRQSQGNRPSYNQDRGFCSQTRTCRDYSKVKCYSCGQLEHMQSCCPRPDTILSFKPTGWYLQSEGRQTSPTPVCTRFIRPPYHLHLSTRHRTLHHLNLGSSLLIIQLLWTHFQGWTFRRRWRNSPVYRRVGGFCHTRSMDESVLQISEAGHWFLEGWIGDHFLVDSGSVYRHSGMLVVCGVVLGAPDGVPHYCV